MGGGGGGGWGGGCVSAMKRLVAFSNFPCNLQSVLCSNIFL